MMLLLLFLLAMRGLAHANSIADWGAEPLEDGARCDVGVVRRANREHLHLLLEELVNTTFFRLFRVGLDGECPSLGSATLIDQAEPVSSSSCQVVTPLPPPSSSGTSQCSVQMEDHQMPSWIHHKQPVDRTISQQEQSSLNLDDLACDSPEFWFDMCDGLVGNENAGAGWVNLQLNPERHTGYNGSKVWEQIYKQACFSEEEQMCTRPHEERVLHRLLSGLHASINTHISLFYYPPKTPNQQQWLPNPQRFMETVGAFPDRLRNLNFAFVVLLRALKKSTSLFNSFSYAVSEDEAENQRTAQLVRRLLDSHLMSSCAQVFDSFDESSMFQNKTTNAELKVKFKRAFRAISETFNCIKCQKCRLHGKMQLTGLGAALKILLLPSPDVQSMDLKREEVVALFNTLHKFSHSIDSIDHLTELSLQHDLPSPPQPPPPQQQQPVFVPPAPTTLQVDLDKLVGSIAQSFYSHELSEAEESKLLEMAASRERNDMLHALAKHYRHDAVKFAAHAKHLVLSVPLAPATEKPPAPAIVVVGSGLAGSTCVLRLLDGGASNVILIEKRALLGGNSVYASSGMNAPVAPGSSDSPSAFAADIAESNGLHGPEFAQHSLVRALTERAGDALNWVRTRTKQAFPDLGKLGGHTFARTWRPAHGLAGTELLHAIHHAFLPYVESGRLQVWKETRVVDVRIVAGSSSQEFSVQVERTGQQRSWTNQSISHVVFATGGFAANSSLVPEHLRLFQTTNMAGATGDAVPILQSLGAKFVDMEHVQLHPTAFITADKEQQQPLCAEIMRGVGGILLNSYGERFCNELGTRSYVSGEILMQDERVVNLVLSKEQAVRAKTFTKMYLRKSLLRVVTSLRELAWFIAPNDADGIVLRKLEWYAKLKEFGSTPGHNLMRETKFYVGKVTPALHYCMGGAAVNELGQVLRNDTQVLHDGLFAVGEVSGGLHGKNRLGGNGMTEALVFGLRVADTILNGKNLPPRVAEEQVTRENEIVVEELRPISVQELAAHKDDFWVAIRGKVYDLSTFAPEHPGGEIVIELIAGTDGTAAFEDVHTLSLLEDLSPIGYLVQ